MLITQALLGEHGVFHLLIEHIEQSLPSSESLSSLQELVAAFAYALEAHATAEDELLFNALEVHLGSQGGPLAIMRLEHNEIRRLTGSIETATEISQARQFVSNMLLVTRGHFQKEERVLFGIAHQLLGEDELLRLGQQWAKRRPPLFIADIP